MGGGETLNKNENETVCARLWISVLYETQDVF